MGLKAGFAEVDITPPIGTEKIGWLKRIVSESVLDPLSARIAVFESADSAVAFVQLDTAFVLWSDVEDVRRRIAAGYAFPGDNIMVSATHNHAGPAIASCGDATRDDAYVESMVRNVVRAFGKALEDLTEAELGFASVFEWDVAHNRRVVMRDGTARTHGDFNDPDALYIEGPIDPEVAVVAARSRAGELLGALVNFACHPTHHGGETALSAGFPGVLAAELKRHGCPVTLYLNGASGNVHTANPARPGPDEKETTGGALARDVVTAFEKMRFRRDTALGSLSTTLRLPFREVTEDEVRGTAPGAQRFIDPAIYERGMSALIERMKKEGGQRADVQVIRLGEFDFVGIPAEYFVEFGLRVKEETHPRHTLIVGYANGSVGYVPTAKAFERGGYETTFMEGKCLAPEAGDILADAAIELVRRLSA